MSVFGEAIGAIREALKLADDVRRTGDTIKELAREVRDQDRRITRLEAQWDTAMAFTAGRGGAMRKLEDKG